MERYCVTGDRIVMTVFPGGFKLKKAAEEDDVLENEQHNEYQSLIGSVMHAAVHTRPDDGLKWFGADGIKPGTLKLSCFTDATWASGEEDQSSVGGFVYMVGGGLSLYARGSRSVAWELRRTMGVKADDGEAVAYLGYANDCFLILRGADQLHSVAEALDRLDSFVICMVGKLLTEQNATKTRLAEKAAAMQQGIETLFAHKSAGRHWEKGSQTWKAIAEFFWESPFAYLPTPINGWEAEQELPCFNRRIMFQGGSPFGNQKGTAAILTTRLGNLLTTKEDGSRGIKDIKSLTVEFGCVASTRWATKAYEAILGEWKALLAAPKSAEAVMAAASVVRTVLARTKEFMYWTVQGTKEGGVATDHLRYLDGSNLEVSRRPYGVSFLANNVVLMVVKGSTVLGEMDALHIKLCQTQVVGDSMRPATPKLIRRVLTGPSSSHSPQQPSSLLRPVVADYECVGTGGTSVGGAGSWGACAEGFGTGGAGSWGSGAGGTDTGGAGFGGVGAEGASFRGVGAEGASSGGVGAGGTSTGGAGSGGARAGGIGIGSAGSGGVGAGGALSTVPAQPDVCYLMRFHRLRQLQREEQEQLVQERLGREEQERLVHERLEQEEEQ
ncbi:unnamed protein product [Closterium sp. NIES-54]